jgi:DNA mismatch repair protein MutH
MQNQVKLCVTEAINKIKEKLSNKIHNITINKNKGNVGHFIEKSIGLTLNSECLDLQDGEVKAFPLKKNKKSDILVPKETIAITMTDKESLKKDDFNSSRLYKKIENIIFVPYLRQNTKVLIFTPILIKLNDNKTLYDKCKQDYDNIQKCLNDTNEIRSKVGEYIQSRTKGQKNSKTRAYYFKTQYIRECITPKILYTDNIKELIKQVI